METNSIILAVAVVLAIVAAVGIAITRNLFYAALGLMLVFLAMAAIFVLLGAEFVAISQIVVYVGGVLVLLVFGILLTNRAEGSKALAASYRIVPALIIAMLCFGMLWQVVGQLSAGNFNPSEGPSMVSTIGINLMTVNVVPFELVAILLLVALVGAASIIKPDKQ